MKLDMVLVTYNPDLELLKLVLDSITPQVRTTYIIDNGSQLSNDLINLSADNIKVLLLNDNKGIAFAQNIGIKESIKDQSDFILISDQDTIYPSDFVGKMLAGNHPDNLAAICPLFHDVNQGNINEGFILKSKFGFERFYPESGVYQIFQAIASGCILNAATIEEIGLMDEGLFIDWVDLEWCWRANSKGYTVLGNADVIITHQLGDGAVNLGFRDVSLRSPIRHYYITRNAFHLALRCKSLGNINQILLFFKSFRYLFGFPILSKPRLKHLKYVTKGFIHGIGGVQGKLKE